MDKLFLLDAYALIYRSYYALIRNPRINSKGFNTSAIVGFCNTLNEILTKEKPNYIGVAFDHGKTFRHKVFPEYKAQWVAHRFGGGVPDMSDLHSTEYVGSALHTFSGYPALRTDLYVPEALLPSR